MTWEEESAFELPSDLEDWAEGDLIPISAIQHYAYCPRQAALIFLDLIWEENIYTLRGRFVHEAVDQPGSEEAGGIRLERALPLWSRRLGLIGKADLVEFHGLVPYPVDYKHGPRREGRHDDLQVCAQAVCLEEMLGVAVPKGAIYHASSRRRREVRFTPDLRRELEETVKAVRELLRQENLPPPAPASRCRHCSLQNSCLPEAMRENQRLRQLLTAIFQPTAGGSQTGKTGPREKPPEV